MKKETKKVTTDDLAVMVAKGFLKIDKRFEQIDKRFEKIDKRFEQIDKKLEQHDKTFELMLKEMQESRQESRAHRMEMSLLNRSDIRARSKSSPCRKTYQGSKLERF